MLCFIVFQIFLGISTALILPQAEVSKPRIITTKLSTTTEPVSKVDVTTTSKLISVGLDDEEFDEEDLFFGTGKVIEMMDDDKSSLLTPIPPVVTEWNPFKLFHWQNEEFDAGIYHLSPLLPTPFISNLHLTTPHRTTLGIPKLTPCALTTTQPSGIFGENVLNTLEDVVLDVKRGLSPYYKSSALFERSILTAKTRRFSPPPFLVPLFPCSFLPRSYHFESIYFLPFPSPPLPPLPFPPLPSLHLPSHISIDNHKNR